MIIFSKKPDIIKVIETKETTKTTEEKASTDTNINTNPNINTKTTNNNKNIGYSLETSGYTCPSAGTNNYQRAGNVGKYQNGKYVYCIIMDTFPTGGFSIDIKKEMLKKKMLLL